MGIKGLMSAMGMNTFATIGLLISFTAFMALVLWIWTRPQNEIETQARLCFEDDEEGTANP